MTLLLYVFLLLPVVPILLLLGSKCETHRRPYRRVLGLAVFMSALFCLTLAYIASGTNEMQRRLSEVSGAEIRLSVFEGPGGELLRSMLTDSRAVLAYTASIVIIGGLVIFNSERRLKKI